MSEELKIGDPVTVLTFALEEGNTSSQTVVWDIFRTVDREVTRFRVQLPVGIVSVYWTEDEGMRWIRGHHEEGSPEVRALLTARALIFP